MTERMNRLANETSPYLLQHAHNPVDWYPWGEEAIAKARSENKAILLSIGYAACHWCHVMERESFESEEIAGIMNEHFVCIKVDREERPDVDEIYMNAVQMITGSGGWPLTVFLTPELKPFYGGTYFPPDDRFGRPGFPSVLTEIARVYREESDKVEGNARLLTDQIQSMAKIPGSAEMLSRDVIRDACRELAARFDGNYGGFGQAPKFPPSAQLSLLMLHHFDSRDPDALKMIETTLHHMKAGGMYDHLGGGFHRYSTDARWLVPHFEKMLYDNALLSKAYLEAYQLTGDENHARTARECLDWVIREMQDDTGGYYSTLDADSEGVEGKFYVWSLDEVRGVLGERAARFCASYDVSAGGNWEGTNILNTPIPLEQVAETEGITIEALRDELATSGKQLLEVRSRREWPGLDDKILTSWNALMIIAMCRAARVLDSDDYYRSAKKAARFILDNLRDEDGRLLATHRNGESKLKAYLDDHAFLLGALVELYETDFEQVWLDEATELAASIERLFSEDEGGLYFTGKDHEELIARTRSGYDGAIPSGNAVAAQYLLRLSKLTANERAARLAQSILRAFQAQFERSPSGFCSLLMALDLYLGETSELAIVGSAQSEATRTGLGRLRRVYAPRTVFAMLDSDREDRPGAELPVLEQKTAGPDPDSPYFYFCRNYACEAPTGDVDEVKSLLEAVSDSVQG